MANELCEILENESLFPTITRLKKLIEDFPNIAEFDLKGEGKSLSHYQNVFVYEKKPFNSQTVNLIKFLKSCSTKEIFAKDMNLYRFTFIYEICKLCKKFNNATTMQFLDLLKSWPSKYIWNIFSSIIKIVNLLDSYDYESIKEGILSKIEELINKSLELVKVSSKDRTDNYLIYEYPSFKINFWNNFVTYKAISGHYFFIQESNSNADNFEGSTKNSTYESSVRQSFVPSSSKITPEESKFTAATSDIVFEKILSKFSDSPLRIMVPGNDIVLNCFIQILSKISSISKQDLRIYLVPSDDKLSTMTNYLAIRDPLYLTLIFKPFLFNPYYKVMPKSDFKGESFQEFAEKNLPDPEHRDFKEKKWNSCSFLKCLDCNIQTYFRQAENKLEVKCYELSLTTDSSCLSFYFCCRVEMGFKSAYFDKEGNYLAPPSHKSHADSILYTPRKEKLTEEVVNSIYNEIKDKITDESSPMFKATIKVHKMDPLEKEYLNNNESDFNRNISIAYLKIINVPDSSDMDFSAAEPNKNFLIIDYIDQVSYDIEEAELENEKTRIKLNKVDRLYQAIKSIHVHLEVSEISISF